MRRFIIIILLILVPSPVYSQCTYSDLINNNSNHPNNILCWPYGTNLGYWYNAENEPVASQPEFDAATNKWNSVGTCYTFTSTGSQGLIRWIVDDWISLPGAPSQTAGAVTGLNANKYAESFIIYLNLDYYTPSQWSTSCGNPAKIDLESVMLHEYGHVLCLKDVSCSNTVMHDSMQIGECRQLHSIDKEAVKYLCDNTAGRLLNFKPIWVDGCIKITWEIIDNETDHYWLERKHSHENVFKKIAESVSYPQSRNIPSRYEHIDRLGSKDAVYKLMEKGSYGNVRVHAIEKCMMPFDIDPNPPPTLDRQKLEKELEVWASKSRVTINPGINGATTTEDWIAIGPNEYIGSEGILALAYWHQQFGLTTGITNLYCIDQYWGGNISDYIAYLYDNGTQYVILVGDANDYELWDDPVIWSVNNWNALKPDYPSQPEYNVISSHYYLDQEISECSMAYFTPYYASELNYTDVNNDNLPDIVLGRIPAHSVDDVLAYGAKAVKYLQNPNGPWEDEISVWIDCRHISGNDGFIADSLGTDLINYIPVEMNTHVLKNPPWPDCYFYSEREAMAIAEFDAGRSLIISFGTVANQYRLNDWLDVEYGFTVSQLAANNIFPFLLGISCGLGAFDETESPSTGRPICERLLFDDSRGFIGIFAPTRGSWQYGNYLMGKRILYYLYSNGAPSLGHACMAAQRDLIWQEPRYEKLARSYVFLGDPALFLSGAVAGEITNVQSAKANLIFSLKPIYPNPFNPCATIEYSIAIEGLVNLKIYDIKGRLVKILFTGTKESGSYRITWDGKNEHGISVATGVYFCRLIIGDFQATQKMVLLR